MERVMKFEEYLKIYEDGEGGGATGSGDSGSGTANVNLGNITGMGPITPAIPSKTIGQSWSGDPAVDMKKGGEGGIGSGDLPVYDTGKSFDKINKDRKKIKKKNAKGDANPYGWDKGYQSMYVTSFANWSGTYTPNTVR